MKNTTFNIDNKKVPHSIVKQFFLSQITNIKDKKDIRQILHYAAAINEIGSPIEQQQIFNLFNVAKYANPKFCEKRYSQFIVKKKSGGERIINAPVNQLKNILKALNFIIQLVCEPSEHATGFVLEKSIVDNAKIHVNSNYVYNIDLKDFFHSFDRNRVKLWFMKAPFNLNGDKEPLAFMLASLCTHPFEIDGKTKIVLPQGSPTSPMLSNLLCITLDRRLNGLAKRFGARYSRYADDITFSSQHNIYNKEEFLNELKRIIEDDQGLKINPQKTRLQKRGYRQEVTGLVVNEKVNIKKKYVKQIRNWLYLWEKYGFEKVNEHFLNDYIADKGHVKNHFPNIINVIEGKLNYLKMIKGDDSEMYQKLLNRFQKLLDKQSPINLLLDIWEKEGIEKAIENYYSNINFQFNQKNNYNSLKNSNWTVLEL